MPTIDAVRLFVGLVTAAAVVALAVRRLPVDYTVGLVLFGLAVGIFLPAGEFQVSPEVVLFVLLPGLVFEAAYRLEFDELRRTFGGVAVLAIPGVFISAAVVALVLHLTMGLSLELGFVVGAMVSATDPVAVTATFRRLRAPRRLTTLVEAESLFNDGTGLVIFAIALGAVSSGVEPGPAIWTFVSTLAASAMIGLVVGYLGSRVGATLDDHLIELTISLVTAYGTYLIADSFHQSGVIATVVAGIVLGNRGRQAGIAPRTLEAIDTVWEFVAFLFTALVFILIGLATPLSTLADSLPWIAWAIVAILIGRAIVVYGLVGFGSRLRHAWSEARPIPAAWLHVMFWAGLRGAVASAMALSLPADFPERSLLVAITFGVVLFTLLVQGGSAAWLVRRLRVGASPA
ncbi:MAG: cation:proton antiporter [Candidatus Limnocylindrales bacterium]